MHDKLVDESVTLQPTVSIIIPNFNHSEFLAKAVDSAIAQNLSSYEIIIIDDASTDNSFEVIISLYGKNPNVRIFRNEENLHTGGAKNKGLAEARGKYVCFLDSDDWYEPEMVSKLLKLVEEHDVDVAACGLKFSYLDGTTRELPLPQLVAQGGNEVLSLFATHAVHGIVVDKLYLREFLTKHNITFCENYSHQDLIFTLQVLYHCRKYASIPDCHYVYYQSPVSISRATNMVLELRSCINLYRSYVDFFEANGFYTDDEKNVIAQSLLTNVCTDQAWQKFKRCVELSTSPEQWKEACFTAAEAEMGARGKAFASFIIALQEKL